MRIREYEIADEALLAKPIEMCGYTLLQHAPVTIIGYKTNVTGYTYSIKVINPVTGEKERYENWVMHGDLLTKDLMIKIKEFDLLCKQLKLA